MNVSISDSFNPKWTLPLPDLGAVDFAAVLDDFAGRLVGGSGDGELGSLDVVDDRVEDEHAADGHLIGRQGAGLVGANDGGATQGLDGWKGSEKVTIIK